MEFSGIYYFASDVMQDLGEPGFGFRGALGYQFNQIRFALESGYNNFPGTNQLISEVTFTPLVLKIGYELPLSSIFSLQADVNFGVLFSQITRYGSAHDITINNSSTDTYTAPLAGARLYAAITPLKFLKFYLGGGTDLIIENSGPVFLPLIEAGISFKPFIAINSAASSEAQRQETNEIVFESRSENITIEESAQGRVVRLRNAVYFEADSSVMIEMYRPILDEAGVRLRANPNLRITLRGFTAPFGTEQGRTEISRARAQYCADYLSRHFGIDPSRIRIESYGALRAPEYRDASWESYRCVELIIQ